MIRSTASRPALALALALIVGGAIGWYSSFELTLAKIDVLTNPGTQLSCNFSVIVQCGKNLGSWQGAVFGFPNPLIGLGGFAAPIVVGAAILAGAQFSRWFWLLFNLGIAGAFAFVIWLMSESIFSLGTLCPWCMVVWAVTIPLFWAVTLRNLATGVIPRPTSLRAFFVDASGWVPLITLLCYLVIAIIAQLRLDVLAHL
jgi:uncharacterized membrane protein